MIIWEIVFFPPLVKLGKKQFKKLKKNLFFCIGLVAMTQITKVQFQKFCKNVTPMLI